MKTKDHSEIYLQPDCCADSDIGRLWCEHDCPEDCDHGNEWTKYVREDIYNGAKEALIAAWDDAFFRSSHVSRRQSRELAEEKWEREYEQT